MSFLHSDLPILIVIELLKDSLHLLLSWHFEAVPVRRSSVGSLGLGLVLLNRSVVREGRSVVSGRLKLIILSV